MVTTFFTTLLLVVVIPAPLNLDPKNDHFPPSASDHRQTPPLGLPGGVAGGVRLRGAAADGGGQRDAEGLHGRGHRVGQNVSWKKLGFGHILTPKKYGHAIFGVPHVLQSNWEKRVQYGAM